MEFESLHSLSLKSARNVKEDTPKLILTDLLQKLPKVKKLNGGWKLSSLS